MPAFALPESLGLQLDGLAAEVRRLRIVRGMTWLVALLFAAPLSALALDATFELSGRARGAMLVAWPALGLVAGWWFVVRRFRETLSTDELARIIEAKFPSLAERLRTLVELSEHADAGNGSRTMMAMLARETERRTKKLDFHRAAPSGFSFRVAGLVAVAVLLAFAPLLFVQGSGDRVRRLVAPWRSPAVEVPYEVVVSSGDPIVKRGQPITVSGYLRKLQPNAALPDSVTVIFREPGSADERKLPMVGDDKSAFTLTRPNVDGDLEYCLECGAIRSDWHTIAAVDPVEVAAGSEVAISAPAYAVALRPTRTIPTLGDFDGLQHGKAALMLKTNRRADDVQLEWRPNDGKAAVERLAVRLDAAGTSASAELPLRVDGTLKWILFAEKGIRTEVAQAVRAVPDAPPKFERVIGLPAQARDIRPGEELSITVVASDDLAVATAFLDFGPAEAADDTALKSDPVTLPGLGTNRVEGTIRFRLPAGAAEGQAFRVRLRIQDNRSMPELDWKPQRSTYPETGWAILRISATARPLAEQELTAKRDDTRSKLESIRKLLEAAHADLKSLRLDFQGRAKLEQDQSVRVSADADSVRDAHRLLEDLGRAGIARIATAAQKLADGDIRSAQIQLKKVLTEADATARDTAALAAQYALETALHKLAALAAAAEAAQANLLDQARLEQLARDQTKLAAEAKAAPNPAELAAEQAKLKDELQKLVQQSEALKAGEADAEGERRRRMTAELERLTRTQRALDDAIRAGDREANAEQLDELIEKQKKLAEKLKQLAERTDLAARLAQTAPLEQKPSRAAADLLEKNKSIDALTEQEKTARELDRLADALEKAAGERGDTRKAVQQLARWQEDLQRRVAEGTKQTPRGDSPADRENWTREQQAIRDATAKLPLPPSTALDKTHQQAKEATAAAADELKRDPGHANESVRRATEALSQLAERTPSQQQRLQSAGAEVEKLRKEQDAIAKEIDDAQRNAKSPDEPELQRKLAATAEKQDELSKKVAKLDAPGSEARRAKAADAGMRAKEDLQKGRAKETAASQQEAKLQLERLKQSLNGQAPADEQAGELARLQKELTENLAKLEKPSADELQRLQRLQNDIVRRLQQLQAPEAQQPLQEAREASQAADSALKKSDPEVDELKKKSRDAQAATQRLNERLNKGGAVPAAPKPDDTAADLPSKKTADEARRLAKEQRGLREELSRIAEKATKPTQPSRGDPLKAQAEKQEQLAKDAERLARDAKAAAEPAAEAKAAEAARKAHAAGEKLAIGDVAAARKDAAEAEKLLGEAGRTATKPALREKADELQKRQAERAADAGKQGELPGNVAARQRAKQNELAKETRELGEQFDESKSPSEGLKRAAAAMEQANRHSAENKPAAAGQARQRAADELAQVQKSMEGAAAAPKPGSQAEAARDAATATREAKRAMEQAEKELSQPSGGAPGPAMQRAADQLKQAAGKLGRADRADDGGTTPGSKAGAADKPATPSAVPSIVQENLGKAWGDLPGEVKTQITQELKAKYGDEYARLIKLYFEQLAERK